MSSPASYPACVHAVTRFDELLTTPLARGVNALCWERALSGDFSEVVRLLRATEGIVRLDEARLLGLPVSPAGRVAVDAMVSDLRLLREHGLAPELNCITAYPRDEEPGPVPTDVFSFHADSAPIEAATWLCTYHGAPSEGLANAEAVRKVDVPAIRAELLAQFGGSEGDEFEEFLRDNCYDLHYAPGRLGPALVIRRGPPLAHCLRLARQPRTAVHPPRAGDGGGRTAAVADKLKDPEPGNLEN